MTTISRPKLWAGAFLGFYRPGSEELRGLDAVSRFLYSARSVILVISAQAAIIAGLLALHDRRFHALAFLGVLIGFVTAHMISNLSNDYFGFRSGHDTPDSPRMRYTIHPFTGGVIDRRLFLTGMAVLVAIGTAITAGFVADQGWAAIGFAAAGLALLVLYDAGPKPLKTIGLGEIATLIVWGPLMIGGGYMMIAGTASPGAFYASLPYGLGVMTILVGKHIDQMPFDGGRGIQTLPVLIGETNARLLLGASLAAMYVIVALLILAGTVTPFAALVVVSLPRGLKAIRIVREPHPAEPPPGYVGWPLWYHRACLVHNRLFGWTYIGGLALGVVWQAVFG
jgi:1,4-dihydroxy-2-naphthoate octaprenyltransferase